MVGEQIPCQSSLIETDNQCTSAYETRVLYQCHEFYKEDFGGNGILSFFPISHLCLLWTDSMNLRVLYPANILPKNLSPNIYGNIYLFSIFG